MKSNNKLNFVVLLTLIVLTGITKAQSLTFEKTDQGAWVRENGEKVLFYQAKTKSMNGTYPRANYIHPLYGIDGFELTEDFPKDHLHHRGIFWAWHQVIIGEQRIGDAWECKDFSWDVKEVNLVLAKDTVITFKSRVFWKSPHWTDNEGDEISFMYENSTITIYARKDNYRIIDVEISLLALEPDLKIGGSDDEKGYGGFSFRVKLPDDISFTSTAGNVKPDINQVVAGPWMEVSGALSEDGGKAGVFMMCHPENPMFPERWILRKSGSMQNPVYPGRLPVSVSMTTPTVLKYRLVVYKGEIESRIIEDIFINQ